MPIGIATATSICEACQQTISAGQVKIWGKGTKARHADCSNVNISIASVIASQQETPTSNITELVNAHVPAHEKLTSFAQNTDIEVLETLLAEAREAKRVREEIEAKIESDRLAKIESDRLLAEEKEKQRYSEEVLIGQTGAVVIEVQETVKPSGNVDLTHVENYVPQNGEVEKIKKAIAAGLNIALKGPAGSGKTTFAHFVASELNAELYEIVGDGGLMREDLIGSRGYNGKETYWLDGTATRALRASRDRFVILYIDEPNRLREELQGALFSIMDHRRRLILPENNGEVIQSKASIDYGKGLIVISSWNDNYRGTTQLDEAFNDRYDVGLSLSYLPEEKEISLLVDRTSIAKNDAQTVVNIASTLRQQLEEKTLQTPISTRALLAWCALVTKGFSLRDAGELALVEKVCGSYDMEKKVIRDVLQANTEGSVTA